MALIRVSFMARAVEHFFMCFLTIPISSFEICMFSSFAHFFIGSLVLWEFSFLNAYKFWLLGSCCLCLYVPVYSLLFPVVVSKFQALF
jgi:hypothetical protein